MADEQPGHINRDVRDATRVPLAKDLVRDNVGSTVKDNSNFNIVSKVKIGCCTIVSNWITPPLEIARTYRIPLVALN